MPIFLTAGMFHVKWWVFIGLDGFAALISVPVWVYLGFFFGANLEQLEKITRRFQVGIYSILIIAILTFAALYFFRRKKSPA